MRALIFLNDLNFRSISLKLWYLTKLCSISWLFNLLFWVIFYLLLIFSSALASLGISLGVKDFQNRRLDCFLVRLGSLCFRGEIGLGIITVWFIIV
jgi:hypothetical protein